MTELQVAWTYAVTDNSAMGMNPIVIDSTMYVIGAGGSVVALHAATGREVWKRELGVPGNRDRGILYWESADRSDRRLFVSRQNFLYAINAASGEPISSFGTAGRADERQGIQRDSNVVNATPSSPGTVFENLLILGSGTGEGYGSGPGDIRAIDAVTGKLAWIFHTIPHPGEFGHDTWHDPNAWKTQGGANAWGGMSVDAQRGIVYIPLGSATYDFYGGNRVGDNLFANSLLALDARTGKRLWHFQTVHHDLWDYDLTATPTLLTVRQNGRARDVVSLATKHGFVFVFDRVTGEPIWPIEERPVPTSDIPFEVTAPTQPFPTKLEPFAVQKMTAEDVNPYLPQAERDSLMRYVASMNNKGLFTPPSTTPTMQMPGNSGGANWGSTAADPTRGLFFVVTKNLPTVLRLQRVVPSAGGATGGGPGGGGGGSAVDRGALVYRQNCQSCHMANLEGQPPRTPGLAAVTQRLTAEQIRAKVRAGGDQMPAFRDLSDQEMAALLVYLATPEWALPPLVAGAPLPPATEEDARAGRLRYQTGYGYFSSSLSWAIKPPWMTMTAYNLNTGEKMWQTPVGDVPALEARGITDSGSRELRGGPTVTAGGLVFMASDQTFRAYDRDTGKQLWSTKLPSNVEGIPSVYEVRGRQYVVIGAGRRAGAGGFGVAAQPVTPDTPHRSYVAFALPERLVRR